MLMVEDHPFMRAVLAEYLRAGYPRARLLEAGDGATAIAMCAARPRVVLMDVSLPDASGIDVAARIKAMLPRTQVIIVSQHSGRAYRQRARAAKVFAYVTKDRAYRELMPAVARALRGRPA